MRAAVARGNSRPWRDGSVEALVAAARRAVEVRAHVRAREAGAKNVRKWGRDALVDALVSPTHWSRRIEVGEFPEGHAGIPG